MPEQSAELVGEYPSTPGSFVCDPSEERLAEDAQEVFFLGILAGLGYTEPEQRRLCSIRNRELVREGGQPTAQNATNDRLSELVVNDRVVASVLRVRTEFNFIQVLFAMYLTRELERHTCFRQLV